MQKFIIVAFLLFFTVPNQSFAQETATTDTTTSSSDTTSSSEQKTASKVTEVPSGEQKSRAKRAIERMQKILSEILGHREEALSEHDVVKLNCVNEKLTGVKGLLRISESSFISLQESLASRDYSVAKHEYEKIMLAMRKCEKLLADSESCIGELADFSGDTEVELVIDEEMKKYEWQGSYSDDTTIGDPTSSDLTDEEEYEDRPPAASPYQ